MSNLFYKNESEENFSVAVGEKAPDFALKNTKGESWRLSDYRGRVVALLLYPKNETLICTKQMCSVRDSWRNYLETKAEIVGISPGTVEGHREFGEKYRLPLPILADENRLVTETYGFHWFYPTNFMRSVVVIDAAGFIRTRRVMLRAFRPADTYVIREIYAARADALQEKYKKLSRREK